MSALTDGLRLSLVVPMYDEEDNVGPLLDEVVAALGECRPFEVLVVDDCSRDRTVERVNDWRRLHPGEDVRLLRFGANRGQSAAVLAGALRARGLFVAAIDGDRQNDPVDLVRMLDLVERGECDGVVGVRRTRRDGWVRRVSSRIANAVRNGITGDRVADSGCGIKVFRRELFLRVPRFDGMHRFMATLARYCGGHVVELEVNHRPRVAGAASYGIGNRALRGLKDCFAVRWMRARMIDPDAREE